jgi:hypothetical protein
MTASPSQARSAAVTTPVDLLAALRAGAGSAVDGAAVGSVDGSPDVSALGAARADAVLAAWTGARLHAGQPGLLVAGDPDLALLVGDWCFAHALQALAHGGDLRAIGLLAAAIGDCAIALTERMDQPADSGRLATIWQGTAKALRAQ